MRRIAVIVACEGEESDAFFERWGRSNKVYEGEYEVFSYREILKDEEVLLAISGAGLVDAASATQYVIDKFAPEVIIKVGLVSGATEKEKLGEVYLVEGAIDASYNITVFGNKPGQHTGSEQIEWANRVMTKGLAKELGLETRIGATTNYFVKDTKAKKALGDGMNKGELRKLYPEVGVFDMEDAAVARVCRRNEVPCVMIAGVSDEYLSGSETYVKMAPVVSREGLVPVLEGVLENL